MSSRSGSAGRRSTGPSWPSSSRPSTPPTRSLSFVPSVTSRACERRRGHPTVNAAGDPSPGRRTSAGQHPRGHLRETRCRTGGSGDRCGCARGCPRRTSHHRSSHRNAPTDGFRDQNRIMELMRRREWVSVDPAEADAVDRQLRRQILTLWQTALIRLSRLRIQDEIEVGLRYYDASLFEVVPRINAELRDALRSRWRIRECSPSRCCGPARGSAATNRDGNPYGHRRRGRTCHHRASETALRTPSRRTGGPRAGAVDVGEGWSPSPGAEPAGRRVR